MSSVQAPRYTVDTIALLGYLADKLPPKVNEAFVQAEKDEATLIVPSIVVGESLFTLLRGRTIFGVKVPTEKLVLFLDALETSPAIRLQDLNVEGWRKAVETTLPELHDRMVVATALISHSSAILTDDQEIATLGGVNTVWR